MKKYRITAADGMEYQVEEEMVEENATEETAPKADEEMLSADEIKTLKKLASKVEDLLKLLEPKANDEEVEVEKEEEEEEVKDEEKEEEEVVDTACKEKKEVEVKAKDSKVSLGAIETKKTVVADTSLENEFDEYWNNYYKTKLNEKK